MEWWVWVIIAVVALVAVLAFFDRRSRNKPLSKRYSDDAKGVIGYEEGAHGRHADLEKPHDDY